MYDLLCDFSQRPTIYSRNTIKELWTRSHLAQQMLQFHLDTKTDLASNKLESIDKAVSWIDSKVGLTGKRVCDLGCGPGLYAKRFAERGALVTGVDFSKHSLEYANSQNNERSNSLSYLHADYLHDELPTGFDLVTLIYCDFCALSPSARSGLLQRVFSMLNSGSFFIFDVFTEAELAAKQEATLIERKLMNGFWSAADYVGLQRSYLYTEDSVSLDRYLIIEANQSWEIFNWLSYFTVETLSAEINNVGFSVEKICTSLTGMPLERNSLTMGIVARKP